MRFWLGVIALTAVILGVVYWDQISWQRFANTNHCVEIDRRTNPPMQIWQTVYDSNGNIEYTYPVWVSQSDTVTYQCDNNQVIER